MSTRPITVMVVDDQKGARMGLSLMIERAEDLHVVAQAVHGRDALEAVRIVSILASPAIPSAAAEAWRRIGLDGRPEDRRVPVDTAWGAYPGGLPVEKADPIFPRVKP